MKCCLVAAYWLLLCFGVGAAAQSLPVLTESFESKQSFQHWSFSNGAEFPGSEGALGSGPGMHGAGAMLSFRFSCSAPKTCGHYVAAVRRFVPALNLPADPVVRFWANVPPEARLTIRMTDETGQTLQHYVLDPSDFEQNSDGGWREVVVSLRGEADGHWGGINDGVFHGKLTQLSIVADARIAPGQGHIGFDELFIGTLPPVKIAPSSAILPAPAGSSVLGARLGVNLHQAPERSLDLAKDAGFSFARVDLSWPRVEVGQHFDFSPYDQIHAELLQRGLGVLWLLGYGHPDHGGKFPNSAEDLEAFGRFSGAAAQHFGGPGNRFEIWNEPDNTLRDPKAFGLIVQAGAEAIRRANPNAEVSSGGISQWNPSFFKDFLLNCDPKPLSAIGFHGYRDRPETIRRDLASLQSLISETCHQDLPVWDTEWGYSAYPKETKAGVGDGHTPALRLRQAVLGTRELLCSWAAGFPLIVWYDLLDDNDNPFDMQGNFGLLSRDLSPKPIFSSIKVLTEIAKFHHYVGLITGLPSGVHAMQLEGNLDVLLVVWNDDAQVKQDLRFTSQQLPSVTDMFGEPVRLSEPRDHQLQLTLAEEDGPIYVQFKK